MKRRNTRKRKRIMYAPIVPVILMRKLALSLPIRPQTDTGIFDILRNGGRLQIMLIQYARKIISADGFTILSSFL